MSENRSNPDQFQLRLPPGLREKLKREATHNARSTNAEIVSRLEQSLKEWPRINIPEDLLAHVRRADIEKRTGIEREITSFAIESIEKALPTPGKLHKDMAMLFYRILANAPVEEQRDLRSLFERLSTSLVKTINYSSNLDHE